MTTLTPMLQQYHELKRRYPGTLLFFRLGDFYELFYDDAITGARELEITLTARHKERGSPIPMCGVPHHSAASYIARLVRKGYRVAICEQLEEAGKAKKLIRRDVVRVITPGTAIDPQLLDAREPVYLAAVCGAGTTFGAAFLDLSTGEFRATETTGPEAWSSIRSEIEQFAPRELLFPASLAPLIREAYGLGADVLPLDAASTVARISPIPELEMSLMPLDDWLWQADICAETLRAQFGAHDLAGYGLDAHPEAVRAAGACLRYARETQRDAVAHVSEIEYFETHDYLVLDAVTTRNLELFESTSKAGREATLLGVIDETVTSMGARALRAWLQRPLVARGEIETRLDAVAALHASQIVRDRLRSTLREVADLERLTARLNMATAGPRDLLALRRSLEQVPAIRRALEGVEASLIKVLVEAADDLQEIRQLIARAISDEPPANLADGGAIRDGFNEELDRLRAISRDAKQTIAEMEARERARTGIASLRIRYNGVFGYCIEVSKANAARVPRDYERRQTLSNVERFTTPELKEWEAQARDAETRTLELETSIFAEVRSKVAAETRRLQTTARALASLDALAALAETAARRRYVRPILHDSDELEIIQGRHPVIEANSAAPFIPNDLYMNNSTDRLLIITGPNMAGKSTLMRQTALIAILAQIGSFVPAERAWLPIFDRIWTRVGASDDLAHGRSTFMVEMTETAGILRGATPRSLVLLDEIGRGTATFDGLSLAWAVAEYLHDSPEHAAKTLFATHYHELTELAERLPGAQNYHVTVAESDGRIIFLYKLARGRASKSYGIEVARLAGLPMSVIERAREVLQRLERYELDVFAEDESPREENEDALRRAARRLRRRAIAAQATLFDAVNQSLLDELRAVDVESLSPEEARALIRDLQRRMV